MVQLKMEAQDCTTKEWKQKIVQLREWKQKMVLLTQAWLVLY